MVDYRAKRSLFKFTKNKKGTAYGEVQQIIQASDTRVTPECQYYVDCGGCSLLETKPNNRRHIKQAMLEEALSRIGKIDLKGASFLKKIGEPQPQGRIRATIHIAPDGRFGFFASQSHNLVAIEQCLALHPFAKIIQSLSEKPCPPLQTEWRLPIACDPTGSVQAAIHNLSPEQQQEVANHLLSNTTMEGVHLIHEDGHTLTTEGKTNC